MLCNLTPTLQQITDSSNACNQVSVVCIPLYGPVQFAIQRGVRLVGQVSPKLPFHFRGSSLYITQFLGPSPLIILNGIPISSAVFVWVLGLDRYWYRVSADNSAVSVILGLGTWQYLQVSVSTDIHFSISADTCSPVVPLLISVFQRPRFICFHSKNW